MSLFRTPSSKAYSTVISSMTDIMKPSLVNNGASSTLYFEKLFAILVISILSVGFMVSPMNMFASKFIQNEYSENGYSMGV